MRHEHEHNNTIRGGATALELLQIAFIVLKLCKVIDWSWLWVLSPIWITAIVVAVILIIIFWRLTHGT